MKHFANFGNCDLLETAFNPLVANQKYFKDVIWPLSASKTSFGINRQSQQPREAEC